MIDRIRHDIQQRLDQLLAEAEKLRHALAALDPRERSTPKPKTDEVTADREASCEDAGRSEADPDAEANPHRQRGEQAQARRRERRQGDQGEGARCAVERSGVDRRRGREGDRARTTDGQHDAVKALEDRRSRQGRPWLPPARQRRRDRERCRPDDHVGHRRRVGILTPPPILHERPASRAVGPRRCDAGADRPASAGRSAIGQLRSARDGCRWAVPRLHSPGWERPPKRQWWISSR